MKKYLDKIKNEKYTSKGKYMEPEIQFSEDIGRGPSTGGYCSYGLFSCEIHIKSKYKNDEGIINHELAHARQFGRLFWIHSALVALSGKNRLLIELEAYRCQVKSYKYTNKVQYEWIITALDTKYKTGIPKYKIREYADYVFKDLICLIC